MSSIYDVYGNEIPIGGGTDDTLEPRAGDVPRLFVTGALPTTKEEGEFPISLTYKSKTSQFTAYATAKVQGGSSSGSGVIKKNYTIKLFSDATRETKYKRSFKHWSPYSKFVIKANWADITHSRNVVGARIWTDMVKSRSDYETLPQELKESDNLGVTDGFPVIMYANGLYYGRYALIITKDDIHNMDKKNPLHAMVQGQANTDLGCAFRSTSTEHWSDELTDDLTHVQPRWQEILSFVMTSTDNEFKANLSNYFSVPSLIDWYLFGIAFFSYDSYGKNQSYLTYDGNYFICSAWDMDGILNSYWTGAMPFNPEEPWYPYQHFVWTNQDTGTHSGYEDGNYLYERLARLFSVEIRARWTMLREHGNSLSFSKINSFFDEWCSYFSKEQMAEDYASTTANGDFVAMGQAPAGNVNTNNIQQIRDFVRRRLIYADNNMI